MPAKLAVKAAVWAIMNPKEAGKVILVVGVLAFFPFFILAAPALLLVSTPLAPPEVLEFYMETTSTATRELAVGTEGPPGIDWRAVIAVDAVRFRQDFSHIEQALLLPPAQREIFVREIQERARMFVEVEDFVDVEEFVGYETIYDEEGNAVGERAVYVMVRVPVYRILSIAEVGTLLGMSVEDIQWAEFMFAKLKERGRI